jgi:hypothetical protein
MGWFGVFIQQACSLRSPHAKATRRKEKEEKKRRPVDKNFSSQIYAQFRRSAALWLREPICM